MYLCRERAAALSLPCATLMMECLSNFPWADHVAEKFLPLRTQPASLNRPCALLGSSSLAYKTSGVGPIPFPTSHSSCKIWYLLNHG